MFEKFKDKTKYCMYFKYMSMIAIGFLVLLVGKQLMDKKLTMDSVPIIVTFLITYFQSRLLYTMCMD